MEPVSDEKQQLGEELFERVVEIETELCAQITGTGCSNYLHVMVQVALIICLLFKD